jgi:hypothetical protein
VVFFPLKGEKRYRIVGIFPEEFNKDEGDILYEEIEERIKTETKLDLDIHDVERIMNKQSIRSETKDEPTGSDIELPTVCRGPVNPPSVITMTL